MDQSSKIPLKSLAIAIIVLLIIVFGVYVAHLNYLLFHTTVETFSVVVCSLIFLFAYKTYKYSESESQLFWGVSYLQIGIVTFLHMITYQGMNIFPGYSSNTPTQLWIAARYLEVGVFCLSPLIYSFKNKRGLIGASMLITALTLVLIAGIMVWPVFPVCFIAGSGLTVFKILSELFVCLIVTVVILILKTKEDFVSSSLYKILKPTILFSIISELSFTLYNDVYGIMNIVGHIFKALSFVSLLVGVVRTGLEEPYGLIFYRIKQSAITDPLTGMYNRKAFDEIVQSFSDQDRIGILSIDIDRFKQINDKFGHLRGDQVLKEIAVLINSAVAEPDCGFRMGGDEFFAILVSDPQGEKIPQAIRDSFARWKAHNPDYSELGLSIGLALWNPRSDQTLDKALSSADSAMYQEKTMKRRSIPPALDA